MQGLYLKTSCGGIERAVAARDTGKDFARALASYLGTENSAACVSYNGQRNANFGAK